MSFKRQLLVLQSDFLLPINFKPGLARRTYLFLGLSANVSSELISGYHFYSATKPTHKPSAGYPFYPAAAGQRNIIQQRYRISFLH